MIKNNYSKIYQPLFREGLGEANEDLIHLPEVFGSYKSPATLGNAKTAITNRKDLSSCEIIFGFLNLEMTR